MSNEQRHTFTSDEIDVHFDARLCIGAGECGAAKGELFVSGRNPWCQPDALPKDEVREIVERCPSGALSYTDKTATAEVAPAENNLTVCPDGPLYLTGDLQIEGVDEGSSGLSFRAALCRCGASQNKPFCDKSHVAANFSDPGAVGETGPGLTAAGGGLQVEMRPDGPLVLTGNLSLRAGSGRLAWSGDRAFLCRCGASKNKPFCDGTHKQIGFKG